jgi:hypothetical protein
MSFADNTRRQDPQSRFLVVWQYRPKYNGITNSTSRLFKGMLTARVTPSGTPRVAESFIDWNPLGVV